MATTPITPEPLIGPQIQAPTPLDPPVVYYNKIWRVPALVVHTQEQADMLSPAEWTTNPPPAAAKEDFPKLMYNINVEPKIVGDADEEKALGGEWREFNLSEALVKAAQAKITAAQKK